MAIWNKPGPDRDVVLSSRVRLARNYADVPFPCAMNEAEAFSVMERTARAFEHIDLPLRYIEMRGTDSLTRGRMVERHVISREMMANSLLGAVLVSPEEDVSIMINEEDHLRLQSMLPGFQLEPALARDAALDDHLGRQETLARDEQYGYLTACLTNVGTGLRASVMMHLPALSLGRRMAAMGESVTRLGMTIRGLYGENTKAYADLYQLSNQLTLGPTAPKIAAAVGEAARQIMALERGGRETLLKQNRLQLEDRVYRALGLLKYARRLSFKEFMNLWSDLRLAASLNMTKGLPLEQLDELMIGCQPLELSAQAGRELKPEERDTLRAERVRLALTAVE